MTDTIACQCPFGCSNRVPLKPVTRCGPQQKIHEACKRKMNCIRTMARKRERLYGLPMPAPVPADAADAPASAEVRTARYWCDDTMRFIECDVVFSGRGPLTDGEGWKQIGEPLIVSMAPGSKDWITEQESKAVSVNLEPFGQRPAKVTARVPKAACACGAAKKRRAIMCLACRREAQRKARHCACGRVSGKKQSRCSRCVESKRKRQAA